MKYLWLLLCVYAFGSTASAEVVKFKTADKVTIAADWHAPPHKKYGAVIALHMYTNDRRAWKSLAGFTKQFEVGVLALDMRGYGGSAKQRRKDWGVRVKDRDEKLFLAMHKDVVAAVKFLRRKGFGPRKIVLIGASLGCSVAIQYAAKSPQIRAAALLTPGKKYFGIDTMAHIKSWGDRPLLIVTSKQEVQSGPRAIYDAIPNKRKAALHQLSQTNIHGTEILAKVSGMPERLMEWASIQLGRKIEQ